MALEIEKMDRVFWIRLNCLFDESIVDIGSNKGDNFLNWEQGQNKRIVFTDIDLYDIPNFVRADAHHLPFKDKEFDVAVLGEILEHVENPVQVLKEAKRVARKKIIITTPNEYEWVPELNPFMPAEEAAKKHGWTIEEMAKNSNQAKEFYAADNYKHLHHNRYYTEEKLREHLKEAGIENYEIKELHTDGPTVETGPTTFIHFAVVCHL